MYFYIYKKHYDSSWQNIIMALVSCKKYIDKVHVILLILA